MFYGASVLVLGLVATPAAITLMRRMGVIDVPNDRSSHTRPTVRGAGVGVALVAIGALGVAGVNETPALLVIALGAGAYSALGMFDDLWDLDALLRLPMQVVIGALVVVALESVGPLHLVLLATIGVVGYLNAFNFMDGINGISGLHALGVGGTWAIAGVLSDVDLAVLLGTVMAGAALAFLPYNFPRARGFLGDAGSYFFGGCIASAAVALYGHLPVLVLALPMAPYVADTVWALFRRVRRGATWHEAHREHVYQRLLLVGWSHARSALLVGALTVASGAGGLLVSYRLEGVVLPTVLLLVVLGSLVAYLALPSMIGEQDQKPVTA